VADTPSSPAPAIAPSPILVRFRGTAPDLPKHARLRHAIIEAVRAGELAAGAKLAGERELSAEVGLSLGTTQKALGRLMEEGFLVRKHGLGTFVGSERHQVAGPRHYRFLDEDGTTELPLYITVVERVIVGNEGPWTRALGADPKGYVMLRRRVDVGGHFICASYMYLPASRFLRLLRIPQKRLDDTNLISLLEHVFSAPTLTSEGVAHLIELSVGDAQELGLAAGASALQVNIVGRTFGRVPIFFQRMLVPPTRYGLKLDFNLQASRDRTPG
jgi:DNA-binding GntR family transcriptional regulator